MDQRDVAVGQRDAHAGRHLDPLTGREGDVDGGDEVCAGVARMGVAGQRNSVVVSSYQHVDHRRAASENQGG